MNNATDGALNNHIYAKQVNWIIPVTVNIHLFVLAVWILIAFVYFGIKNGIWNRKNKSNHEKLTAGTIFIFAMFFPSICLLRYVTSMIAMNVGFDDMSSQLCQIICKLTYAMYILVLYLVNVFLWLRQRTFYVHKMLNVSYNIKIKIISFASIFFVTIIWVFAYIYHAHAIDYFSTSNGCEDKPNIERDPVKLLSIVLPVLFMHSLLLGLFAYALLRIKHSNLHQRFPSFKVKDSDLKSIDKSQTLPHPRTYTGFSLSPQIRQKISTLRNLTLNIPSPSIADTKTKKLLTKTFVYALIITVCDLMTHVIVFYIVGHVANHRWKLMVYDLNTFLNLLFLVFSFDAYKEILKSPLSFILKK